MELCTSASVVIVASFPSVNAGQTDSQRGKGIWESSISTLKRLNELGYGKEGTGLELNLVSNPAGAFLPVAQAQAEKRFKQELGLKHGIIFNNLFTFANVPAGRFRTWLKSSGNYSGYIEKLASRFNPGTVDCLMCRTLVSVDWNGYLYDCDFNLAAGLYLGGRKRHVSEMEGPPEQEKPIVTGDHCYACTAGSGFT
jgi:radical SAM/Cys-rich protein